MLEHDKERSLSILRIKGALRARGQGNEDAPPPEELHRKGAERARRHSRYRRSSPARRLANHSRRHGEV